MLASRTTEAAAPATNTIAAATGNAIRSDRTNRARPMHTTLHSSANEASELGAHYP
jgi:hypothetical protein